MKDSIRKEVIVFAAGVLTAVVVIIVASVLSSYGLHLGTEGIGLGSSTLLIFGLLGFLYRDDLRSPRCAVVFSLLVIGHIELLLCLLRHGVEIPNLVYGFTDVIEFGVAGVILIVVGGAKKGYMSQSYRRTRCKTDRDSQG